MAVEGVIDQLVAAEDVGALDPVAEGLVLDGSPLDRHLQLVPAAAPAQPPEEAYQGEVHHYHPQDERHLSQHYHVPEHAVDGVREGGDREREGHRLGSENACSMAPDREEAVQQDYEGDDVDDGLVEGLVGWDLDGVPNHDGPLAEVCPDHA